MSYTLTATITARDAAASVSLDGAIDAQITDEEGRSLGSVTLVPDYAGGLEPAGDSLDCWADDSAAAWIVADPDDRAARVAAIVDAVERAAACDDSDDSDDTGPVICIAARYCPWPDEFSSVAEFRAMCREVFGAAPRLVRDGDEWREAGIVVLVPAVCVTAARDADGRIVVRSHGDVIGAIDASGTWDDDLTGAYSAGATHDHAAFRRAVDDAIGAA